MQGDKYDIQMFLKMMKYMSRTDTICIYDNQENAFKKYQTNQFSIRIQNLICQS